MKKLSLLLGLCLSHSFSAILFVESSRPEETYFLVVNREDSEFHFLSCRKSENRTVVETATAFSKGAFTLDELAKNFQCESKRIGLTAAIATSLGELDKRATDTSLALVGRALAFSSSLFFLFRSYQFASADLDQPDRICKYRRLKIAGLVGGVTGSVLLLLYAQQLTEDSYFRQKAWKEDIPHVFGTHKESPEWQPMGPNVYYFQPKNLSLEEVQNDLLRFF